MEAPLLYACDTVPMAVYDLGRLTAAEDAAEAAAYARAHPEKQEVRIVAAATRGGRTYCALRLRAHDDPFSVVEGADLVPGLLELLAGTLAAGDDARRDEGTMQGE